MMYGNWSDYGCSSGMFGFWKILIIIGLIILIVALIISWNNNRNRDDLLLANNQPVNTTTRVNQSISDNSIALDKLKMMYATGEITEEEYLKRKAVIERG